MRGEDGAALNLEVGMPDATSMRHVASPRPRYAGSTKTSQRPANVGPSVTTRLKPTCAPPAPASPPNGPKLGDPSSERSNTARGIPLAQYDWSCS